MQDWWKTSPESLKAKGSGGNCADGPESTISVVLSSCETMELNGQKLDLSCLSCEKEHPFPILWTKFSGVIPSRIGRRMIVGMNINSFDLLNIYRVSFNLVLFAWCSLKSRCDIRNTRIVPGSANYGRIFLENYPTGF